MDLTEIVLQIEKSLQELNQQLPPEAQIEVSPDAILLGSDGRLDSLGLVNLILLIEERMADELGAVISLTDENTLSQPEAVFRDVQTLARHILALTGRGASDVRGSR
jgi:acyl carrier protein